MGFRHYAGPKNIHGKRSIRGGAPEIEFGLNVFVREQAQCALQHLFRVFNCLFRKGLQRLRAAPLPSSSSSSFSFSSRSHGYSSPRLSFQTLTPSPSLHVWARQWWEKVWFGFNALLGVQVFILHALFLYVLIFMCCCSCEVCKKGEEISTFGEETEEDGRRLRRPEAGDTQWWGLLTPWYLYLAFVWFYDEELLKTLR